MFGIPQLILLICLDEIEHILRLIQNTTIRSFMQHLELITGT